MNDISPFFSCRCSNFFFYTLTGKGGKNRRRGKGDGEESKRELEFKEDGKFLFVSFFGLAVLIQVEIDLQIVQSDSILYFLGTQQLTHRHDYK